MLTHLPKNPYCASCIRAKMNARQARRRHAQSRAKSFGEIVTADHLIPRDDDGQGIDNDKVALVVKDHFSGWIDIYPAACKSADEVVLALNHFQGTTRSTSIKLFYSDNAPELVAAGRRLKLQHKIGRAHV